MSTGLVLFGNDLRLDDHPALFRACAKCDTLVLAYVLDEHPPRYRHPGAASNGYLHHSLIALQQALRRKNRELILRRGDGIPTILHLVEACRADQVYWNRSADPVVVEWENRLIDALKERGVSAHTFQCETLFPMGAVLNGQGAPYKVFTPFYKACLRVGPPNKPLSAPARIPAGSGSISLLNIEQLGLLPKRDWAKTFSEFWSAGESAAHEQLVRFLDDGLFSYAHARDELGRMGTSRLSAALHFGELSVRRVWHILADQCGASSEPFLRQLLWREFARSLLDFAPHTVTKPLNARFNDFPWRTDATQLRAWHQGQTGYPVVDAGMRELWQTGYMHNRARMIVGSFLVKDLRLHWREGERWFWDTLVDADLANNVMGWQWIGGCGADAAPYFRIFNPVTQGQKFDPTGDYVRRWVPELSKVPNRWLHAPWTAMPQDLESWGIRLGRDYPPPVVEHSQARKEALDAWRSIRRRSTQQSL